MGKYFPLTIQFEVGPNDSNILIAINHNSGEPEETGAVGLPTFRECMGSVDYIKNNGGGNEFNSWVSVADRFRELFDIKAKQKEGDPNLLEEFSRKTSLQAKLYKLLVINSFDAFKSILKERIRVGTKSHAFKKLAVLISTSNGIPGQFLNAPPKGKGFKLTSLEFQTALCSRLFSSQILYPENTRCTCLNNPLLDPQGIHATTECGKYGYRHKNHDSVVEYVRESLNQLQITSQMKKLNVFRDIADDEKRPDLLVVNPEGTDRSCLIDVRITHPLVGRTNLNRPHQSMSNSYNEKNAKYAELSFDCGYDFLPFIVSSTGQIDERSLS